MRTRRVSPLGLFDLEFLSGKLTENSPRNARSALGHFWRQWFLTRLNRHTQSQTPDLASAACRLAEFHPRALPLLHAHLPRIQAECALALRRNTPLPEEFWRGTPPLLRPLTGYLQLLLENGDYRRDVWKETLEHLEHLAALL